MDHRSFGVDYEIVWEVATEKAPKWVEPVRTILDQENAA